MALAGIFVAAAITAFGYMAVMKKAERDMPRLNVIDREKYLQKQEENGRTKPERNTGNDSGTTDGGTSDTTGTDTEGTSEEEPTRQSGEQQVLQGKSSDTSTDNEQQSGGDERNTEDNQEGNQSSGNAIPDVEPADESESTEGTEDTTESTDKQKE